MTTNGAAVISILTPVLICLIEIESLANQKKTGCVHSIPYLKTAAVKQLSCPWINNLRAALPVRCCLFGFYPPK
jgi:hypothetical protein